MKHKTKQLIFILIGVGLCAILFSNALLNTRMKAPEKGVWVIQPFFAYNLTRGDGGPNHTVEGQQVLRIFPVGDGHRFNLYGAVNYSLASDEPYSLDRTPRYVIEGTRTFRYSDGNRFVWIKVDRMYEQRPPPRGDQPK